MSYKKILITGASGQDGKILTAILNKKKFKVIACIKKKKIKKIKGVIYEYVNLFHKKKFSKILEKYNPSTVVHFASNNPAFIDKKKGDYFSNYNYRMTKNIIDSIKDLKKNIHFIFPNSSQIFLKNKKNKYNEKDKFFPNNSYCKFRIKTVKYLKKTNLSTKFKYTNLILFNHDSIFRNKKFLLPRIVSAVKKNNEVFLNMIYQENIIQDFSHAEDICHAIYLLIKKNTNIDNLILSSSKKTNVNSIINYLIKKYSKKIMIKSKPKLNKNFMIGDNRLARNILKWKSSKNIYIAADELYNELP
tara:strand:+ start:2181 stop:3089 length:909 start_codon:yes stop_codon:yes gene_type:complete